MRLILSLLLGASVFAQPLAPQTLWCCNDITGPFFEIDTDVPVDPITDKLRYEIAAAQRDYLIVKAPYDAALAQLRSKMEQADKTCKEQGKTFSIDKFVCEAASK